VSAIQRFADTAYDARNFSILSVDFSSHKQEVTYYPDDFKLLFDTMFTDKSTDNSTGNSTGNSTDNSTDNSTAATLPSDNAIMVDAVLYDLGWVLRLYHDLFPSDTKTPINLLQNILIIPIHFSTAAWEYTNATFASNPIATELGLFALPTDLARSVSGARRSPRVMAVPWSVYVFISTASMLLLYGLAILLWIMAQTQAFPNSSGFAELVFSARSQTPAQEDSRSAATASAAQFLWRHGLSNAGSHAAAKACAGIKIKAVAMRNIEDKKRVCIIVVPPTGMGTECDMGELLKSQQDYL
jgi:hypothetical protein